MTYNLIIKRLLFILICLFMITINIKPQSVFWPSVFSGLGGLSQGLKDGYKTQYKLTKDEKYNTYVSDLNYAVWATRISIAISLHNFYNDSKQNNWKLFKAGCLSFTSYLLASQFGYNMSRNKPVFKDQSGPLVFNLKLLFFGISILLNVFNIF